MVPWDEVEFVLCEFRWHRTRLPCQERADPYGALLIKEQLGITDEETFEQIAENPYLQT